MRVELPGELAADPRVVAHRPRARPAGSQRRRGGRRARSAARPGSAGPPARPDRRPGSRRAPLGLGVLGWRAAGPRRAGRRPCAAAGAGRLIAQDLDRLVRLLAGRVELAQREHRLRDVGRIAAHGLLQRRLRRGQGGGVLGREVEIDRADGAQHVEVLRRELAAPRTRSGRGAAQIFLPRAGSARSVRRRGRGAGRARARHRANRERAARPRRGGERLGHRALDGQQLGQRELVRGGGRRGGRSRQQACAAGGERAARRASGQCGGKALHTRQDSSHASRFTRPAGATL